MPQTKERGGNSEAGSKPGSRARPKAGGGSGGGSKAGGSERSRGSGTSGRSRTDTNLTAEDRTFLDRVGTRLSPSTLRARWIHSPDEKAQRPGQTLATRSPEVIRAWAEERGGRPMTVRRDDAEIRVLRFDFNTQNDNDDGGRVSRLRPIPWEDWLRVFEERNLVFLYQDRKKDGNQSNFFRLDSPDREEG